MITSSAWVEKYLFKVFFGWIAIGQISTCEELPFISLESILFSSLLHDRIKLFF